MQTAKQAVPKVAAEIRAASGQGLPNASMKDEICPACHDTGQRPMTDADLPHVDAETAQYFKRGYSYSLPCEACLPKRIHKARAKWQDFSGLTDNERALRLTSIATDEQSKGTSAMMDASREMLEGKAFFLTIQGTPGNGKTAVLIAMTNEMLDKGRPAIYITLADALDWISDAFRSDGGVKDGAGSALERFEILEGIRFLALDEMQDVKLTDWRMEKLASLINRRQRDAIAGTSFTMLATNKPIETLPPQIASRLRDGRNRTEGSPVIINMDGDIRPDLKRKPIKTGKR